MMNGLGALLAEITYPEPAFRIGSSKHLLLEPADSAAQDYLARAVAASPGDLLSHTRRVFLSQRRNDPDELRAALIDLFVATGSKGLALRQRLLHVSAGTLTADDYAFLESKLDTGLAAHEAVTCPQSMLGSPVNIQRQAIRRRPDQGPQASIKP